MKLYYQFKIDIVLNKFGEVHTHCRVTAKNYKDAISKVSTWLITEKLDRQETISLVNEVKVKLRQCDCVAYFIKTNGEKYQPKNIMNYYK